MNQVEFISFFYSYQYSARNFQYQCKTIGFEKEKTPNLLKVLSKDVLQEIKNAFTIHTYLHLYLGEKKLQEKWSKPGLLLMSKDELLIFSKFSNEGFKSCQLTSAGRSAHNWQVGWHRLAGNS